MDNFRLSEAQMRIFFDKLMLDPYFRAIADRELAALQQAPSPSDDIITEFSDVLDSPISPPELEPGSSAASPRPIPLRDSRVLVHTSAPPPHPSSDAEEGNSSASRSSDDDGFTTVSAGGKRKKKGKSKAPSKAIRTDAPPVPSPSPARSGPAPQISRPSSPMEAEAIPAPPTPPAPAAAAGTASSAASSKKQRPVPPFYIQDKGQWTAVSKMCSVNAINYTSARACQHGIRVQVPTPTDYRRLTLMLRERNISFHTYSLPEDKPTRVVIRRIPKEISTEDIKDDLISQGINVQAVHRLHKARGGHQYDMVLVVCDPFEGHHPIHLIKSVCSLTGIKVEKPYRPGSIGQCHRCQLYGHSQAYCHAKPRCVKCLGDHGTVDCSRPKDRTQCTEPPSCVLCGQAGHPANYRGCAKAPKISPKLAKRANARQQRESPSSVKIPSSQLPDQLRPQRPSPWNRLNQQQAFPPLPPVHSAPPLMANPIAAPTPAPVAPTATPALLPTPQTSGPGIMDAAQANAIIANAYRKIYPPAIVMAWEIQHMLNPLDTRELQRIVASYPTLQPATHPTNSLNSQHE